MLLLLLLLPLLPLPLLLLLLLLLLRVSASTSRPQCRTGTRHSSRQPSAVSAFQSRVVVLPPHRL